MSFHHSSFSTTATIGQDLDQRAHIGLIARDRELADLECALWQCRQGDSSAEVLRGEPGIGKSALLAAVTARARDFDVVQLRASAMSNGSVPPEWPEPLASLRLEGGGGPGGEMRSRVAAAVRALSLARSSPTLLTIDDAQYLPTWFLQALLTVVSEEAVGHPVLAVVAVRDLPHTEPLQLAVETAVERRLTSLTIEQSLLLLGRIDGRQAQPQVSRSLFYAVGGNPQALLSAYAHVDPDVLNGWRQLAEPVRTDDALLEAFGTCLTALPEATRRCLATAAAGRLPIAVLNTAVAELGLEMAAFKPAEEAGIVLVRRNRIDFAHPLVRCAAYYQESEAARAEVHDGLARAFAKAGLIEMSAQHASQSGSSPQAAVAGLFGQAARIALDRGDMAAAARYEEAMARSGDSGESVAHHLVQAASRWLCVGAVERAIHCLDRALALETSDEMRALVSYWRSRVTYAEAVGPDLADRLVEAAELAAGRPSQASVMLADAALCLLLSGMALEAEAVATRAAEAAERVSGFVAAYAGAVLGAVRVIGCRPGEAGDKLRSATAFLASQPDAVPLSPLFAFVVGNALLLRLGPEAATTWAMWIDRSAASTGNRSLGCVPMLVSGLVAARQGRLEEAATLHGEAAEAAALSGQGFLAARATGELLEVQSMQGNYKEAFATAARLFSAQPDGASGARLRAYRALAELELQRGYVPSALGWLKAAEFEAVSFESSPDPSEHRGRVAASVAALAEILVHDQQLAALRSIVADVEDAAANGAVAAAWAPAVRAVASDDDELAEELSEQAMQLASDEPLLGARIEYLLSTRMLRCGLLEKGAGRLRSAVDTARRIGADGWAVAFDRSLEKAGLPHGSFSEVISNGASPKGSRTELSLGGGIGKSSESPGRKRLDPAATWEITMLGSFAVRHEEALVGMPVSLAATALKIVALRRRILVEELVEELWPDSAPGVGMRRLRNVLWRIRVASGDILVREDKFILLSPRAVTDAEIFRRLASQALDPATPADKAADLAENASALYGGELLPADRYADWAAVQRESLARMNIQLIELRVRHAVEEERIAEALGLLEVLMESDPYEEEHYMRAAELHAKIGNRKRAVATLQRAERRLSEFGYPVSAAMRRLADSIS